jgi:hypothetical protein
MFRARMAFRPCLPYLIFSRFLAFSLCNRCLLVVDSAGSVAVEAAVDSVSACNSRLQLHRLHRWRPLLRSRLQHRKHLLVHLDRQHISRTKAINIRQRKDHRLHYVPLLV